jgi:hypothetical protein
MTRPTPLQSTRPNQPFYAGRLARGLDQSDFPLADVEMAP